MLELGEEGLTVSNSNGLFFFFGTFSTIEQIGSHVYNMGSCSHSGCLLMIPGLPGVQC